MQRKINAKKRKRKRKSHIELQLELRSCRLEPPQLEYSSRKYSRAAAALCLSRSFAA